MDWWLWILLGLALLVLEMLTPGGLFALFFGLSALAVSALAALGAGPGWLQWLVFAALGVVLLLALRSRVEERLRRRRIRVDSLVGEVALPLSDLAAGGTGTVELRGTTWQCRNAGERPIPRGARCQVEKVEGLTLWVRPE
jgi:membrane protein implicated in regulation of membrane protease activity